MSQDKNVKYITVGDNANFFHDAYSGVTISKGEVVALTANQLVSKRVKSALAQGHLVYTEKPGEEKEVTVDLPALISKLETVSKANSKTVEDVVTYNYAAIAKKFSMDELKALCADNEIEVEEEDTKVTLLTALLTD